MLFGVSRAEERFVVRRCGSGADRPITDRDNQIAIYCTPVPIAGYAGGTRIEPVTPAV